MQYMPYVLRYVTNSRKFQKLFINMKRIAAPIGFQQSKLTDALFDLLTKILPEEEKNNSQLSHKLF